MIISQVCLFFKQKIFQIEIKLKKAEGLQWTNLEGDGQRFHVKVPLTGTASAGLTLIFFLTHMT